jgi:hypothetical protein
MEMQNTKLVAGLLLASCLVTAPAYATGLLSGVLGGGSSSSSTSSGGGLGSTLSHVVSGLTGGGSTSTPSNSVGVPGVATASLSSTSGGTQGHVTALGGGGNTLNVGLGGLLGGNSNLGVTLPGSGTGLDGTLSGVANTVNGLTGNGGTVDTLLSSTGLTGDNGGLGGLLGGNGGLLGTSGGDNGSGANNGTNPRNGPGSRRGIMEYPGFAALGAACRNADLNGVVAVMQGGHYNKHTLYRWRHAANIQVVPLKTCAALRRDIRKAVARNGNLQMVQQLAAADPLVSASLDRTHYRAGNVLGVGQANGTLTVYVY